MAWCQLTHLYLSGTPTVVSLFLYLPLCILISKMHSFVKQDKKAWLSYVDGKSLSLCMPWRHRWKEADVAHFQVLSYYILRERLQKTLNIKGQTVSELKFQCRTSWIQSRVLPPLLQYFVDTCKFTSWNYKESVISSLLYQMFLLSITEDNWQYTVESRCIVFEGDGENKRWMRKNDQSKYVVLSSSKVS